MITLLNCALAHKAITGISDKPMPYKAAHQIMMLKRKLSPHVEFYAQEEMKIIERFAKHDDKGFVIFSDGRFTIPNENYSEYTMKIQELNTTEIEWEAVRIDGMDNLEFTVDALEAFEGVIKFADD